ncbi:aminoglycoside phosphotransferase family protein [Microbacterium sp. DT81.1]|uniref:aminoglycoside phosphotransferase family protein n=1 Tax=Microbacterium sp. DT81.1 TaxID=3393413 RepID=UPI003CF720C1
MHEDQLHVDVDIARLLIYEQFPQWGNEPIAELPTAGTVNAIFRIGEHLTARFPLRPEPPGFAFELLRTEAAALTELAACSPFPAPRPVAIGLGGHGYPSPWSVQTWLDGNQATPDGLAHSAAFAGDIALLIQAFRATDTGGRTFSGRGRGGDLQAEDEWMAVCLRESEGLLDVHRLRMLWTRFRVLPGGGPDVLSHGDLIPGNLLVRGDRLAGVLDGGGFGAADPALDLVAAWHLFEPHARVVLRETVGSDDIEWARGAAWAFAQAMGLAWYYHDTNPVMSRLGLITLARILDAPDL